MTDEEIKKIADATSKEMKALLQDRAGKLPTGIALAIPLTVAVALFRSTGRPRDQAIAMLNVLFDNVEDSKK